MPELPEVQTIVNDLNKKTKGYEIADFWTDWKKSIKMPLAKFKKEIISRKIKEIGRKGKTILIYLTGEKNNAIEKILTIHLKMTGHLLVKSKKLKSGKSKKYFNEKVNQYIHHIWNLEKGKTEKTLEFSDLRKFGKIRLLKKGKIPKDDELNKLGVDPTSAEFTVKKLKEILEKKPKTIIRGVLMDQNLIAGIGNIYASEILFEAKINPKRLAGELKKKEVKTLHACIKKILKKAIQMRGTTDSDYRDTQGVPGGFQKVLKVYNREGERCKKCNCKIKREKINQRSAYFCESCQK